MLYRNEKPYVYKCAFVFGILGLVGCLAMADNVYLILCKDLFNGAIPLFERLKNHALPLAAVLTGVVAGKINLLSPFVNQYGAIEL